MGQALPSAIDSNPPGADLIEWLESGENIMVALKIIALIFVLVFGIPNQIIDYKHRKLYEPGHAWGYYAKLSNEGNWAGRFMMWSGYIGIYFIVGALGYTFYLLTR